MPVPIMFDTTSAVALTNPSCRISVAGDRGRDVVEVAIGIWSDSSAASGEQNSIVCFIHLPENFVPGCPACMLTCRSRHSLLHFAVLEQCQLRSRMCRCTTEKAKTSIFG